MDKAKDYYYNEYGWRLLYTISFVEVWETSNKSFLVCYKYGRIYKFFRNYQKAKIEALALLRELTDN